MAVQLKDHFASPSAEHMRKQILSILGKKWISVFENEEAELKEKHVVINLFECFESVVSAFGLNIEPFAMTIFKQCCRIFTRFIALVKADEDYLESEGALFQRSIELISILFNALGQRAQSLLANPPSAQIQQPAAANANEFISTVLELLDINDANVRQYVFGLLGDMQKHMLSEAFSLQLPQLILSAIDNLCSQSLPVCNNACWFLGEVAVVNSNREIIKPFLHQIAGKLCEIY